MSSDHQDDEKVNHRKRRRNRMRVSCLNCYASKRKCDRKRPCTRCIKHGLTGLCVYELDDPDTRDSALDETTHLRNRIAELESVIRELNNRPHPRWFASNGVEHVPELVATRRCAGKSTAEDGDGDSPSPSKTCRIPFRHGARSSIASPVSPNKTGSKRKHDQVTPSKSLSLSDACKKLGRKAYASDDSYCTDEDEDDEDYEEHQSRSRPKITAVPAAGRSRGLAEHFLDAYSRSETPGTPSLRTSASRSISTSSSNPPFTPLTISSRGSTHGLMFDVPVKIDEDDTDHIKVDTDAKVAADADDESPAKVYSLRANVVWDDQSEIPDRRGAGITKHNTTTGSGTGSRLKLLVEKSSKSKDLKDIAGSTSASTVSQKKNLREIAKENNNNNGTPSATVQRLGRSVDEDVQILKAPFHFSLESINSWNSGSCSCLDDIEVRNEVTFLIVTLGDISNVLKAAHTSCDTQGGCELFKRVVELDEYFSTVTAQQDVSSSKKHDDNTPESNVAPGPVHIESHPPITAKSAKLPKPQVQSTEPSTNDRKKRSRTWSNESRNSTTSNRTPSLSSKDNMDETMEVKKVTNNATAILPAPTPASILEQSLARSRQLVSTQDTVTPAPPTTVTLASVLAEALIPDHTISPQHSNTVSQSQSTQPTKPPRYFSTPDPTPTPTIPPTPTFSPSSPIIRPANSAMRRPDAAFLPFYSYALAAPGCGGGVGGIGIGIGMGTGTDGPAQLLPGSGAPKMEIEIGGDANSSGRAGNASDHHSHNVVDDVNNVSLGVVVGPPPSLALASDNAISMNAIEIEMDLDVDADAEGEPAPESGYHYGYFEDGYRYEYVYIEDRV